MPSPHLVLLLTLQGHDHGGRTQEQPYVEHQIQDSAQPRFSRHPIRKHRPGGLLNRRWQHVRCNGVYVCMCACVAVGMVRRQYVGCDGPGVARALPSQLTIVRGKQTCPQAALSVRRWRSCLHHVVACSHNSGPAHRSKRRLTTAQCWPPRVGTAVGTLHWQCLTNVLTSSVLYFFLHSHIAQAESRGAGPTTTSLRKPLPPLLLPSPTISPRQNPATAVSTTSTTAWTQGLCRCVFCYTFMQ